MMDFVQRASSRPAGILDVSAHLPVFAGPFPETRARKPEARSTRGPELALGLGRSLPQPTGDWYERLA